MKRLYILFLFLLTFASFGHVSAQTVTQFVFSTEPQTVEVDTLSKTITVQSQNSSGTQEDTTETFDITFTSTSATGQFFSTTGNPVSTTMSRGTANKNFLYRDSVPGTHTINITAVGRTSLSIFSASQSIEVLAVGSTPNSPTSSSTTSTTTASQTTQSNNIVTTVTYSVHSSPVPLSNTENKVEFEIDSGRDRVALVGNQLVFVANNTKLQNISEQAMRYEWSFGDGSIKQGKVVNHQYGFPGEYSVVLNAYSGDKQAVSRTKVKVLSPDFSVERLSGGIQVKNKSNTEVNIEGWKLVGGGKEYIIPKDTIIFSGNSVVFPDNITGVTSDEIRFLNQLSKNFGETEKTIIIVATSTLIADGDIQNKIEEVKKELSKISSSVAVSPKKTEVVDKNPIIVEEQNKAVSSKDDQLASVISVFEAPQRSSLISRIFYWPSRGVDMIAGLFR